MRTPRRTWPAAGSAISGVARLAPRRRPAPGTTAGNPEPPAGRAYRRPARGAAAPATVSRPWTDRQERLGLLYNEQGLRPDEIAAKLGVSTYLATQIVLAARDRRRPEGPAVLRSDPRRRTRKPA